MRWRSHAPSTSPGSHASRSAASAPAARCAPPWRRPRRSGQNRCRHWRTGIRRRARREGPDRPPRRCRPSVSCAPCVVLPFLAIARSAPTKQSLSGEPKSAGDCFAALAMTTCKAGGHPIGYQTIEVSKLTPYIGAEIGGVDLSCPLGNQQFQEVHDALMDNLVVFFRDQNLTHDQHKAFGRRFGELAIHPASPHAPEGHTEILTIHADENSKHVAGEEWHSDVSRDAEPPMGSILYLTEVPPEGGDTLFASMYAAYDKLSEPIKRLVEGLTAIHDGEPVYRGRVGYAAPAEGFS